MPPTGHQRCVGRVRMEHGLLTARNVAIRVGTKRGPITVRDLSYLPDVGSLDVNACIKPGSGRFPLNLRML
jgi:hypothetical protein